jgi:rRNA maturation endonuclease Nob1
MQKCDHCGVRNPDNRTACDFCGELLDTPSPLQIGMNVTTDLNAQVAVNTGFALNARTQAYKICPVCQQSTVLNMMICAQCGHRFYTPTTLPAQSQMFYLPFDLNHFRSELKTHWLLIAVM